MSVNFSKSLACKNTVCENRKVSFGCSTKQLNTLFLQNGFLKAPNGELYKSFSSGESANLNKEWGMYSDDIKKQVSHISKASLNKFKSFLDIGDNLGKAKSNFIETLSLFLNMSADDVNKNNIVNLMKKNKNLQGLFNNIYSNSSDKEQLCSAIANYKGSYYRNVNKHLRENAEIGPAANRTLKTLSSFLDTQKIEKPMNLFRGEKIEVLNNVKTKSGETVDLAKMIMNTNGEKKEINKVIEFILDNEITVQQKSFMSTSLDKKCAERFADIAEVEFPVCVRPNKIVWSLETMPNTKGAFIEPLNIGGHLSTEAEVLLQKGSNIKITDVRYDNGVWYFKAKVSN